MDQAGKLYFIEEFNEGFCTEKSVSAGANAHVGCGKHS
jgi:hypothetical protein